MEALTPQNNMVPATTTGAELQTAGAAAMAKATIEAKFTIAMHNKRNVMDARTTLLEACTRPRFAATALYAKPIGDGKIEGLSIRFAESAIQAWRNVDVSAVTAWEDTKQRLVRITVTDLESNISYSDEVLLNKTVERLFVKKGQTVLSERKNSAGKTTYLVIATEDEMQNKLNAAKSKSIRNSGLRLMPQDILEECQDKIRETIAKGGGDSLADKIKGICDAFAQIGVKPSNLETYLGHALDQISPAEVVDLRAIYTTISEGEATWQQYVEGDTEEGATEPEVKSKSEKIAGKVKGAKKKGAAAKKKAAPKQEAATETEPPSNEPAEDQGEVTEPEPPAETEPEPTEPVVEGPSLTAEQEIVQEFLGITEIDFAQLVGYCQTYGLDAEPGIQHASQLPQETCVALTKNKQAPNLPNLKSKFGKAE